MKKFTKALSLFLAVILAISVAVPAFAEGEDETVISRIDIAIKSGLDGMTPLDVDDFFRVRDNVEIEVADNYMYFRAFDGDRQLDDIDTFVGGKEYTFTCRIVPLEGYSFDNSVDVYVNSVKTGTCVIDDGKAIVTVNYTPLTEDKVIKRIDLSFDNEIAGKTLADCEDYFTTNTEHVKIVQLDADIDHDGGESVALDSGFINGQKYYYFSQIIADKGYGISNDVEIYINGEKADYKHSFVNFWDMYYAQDMAIAGFEQTIEKQPNFLTRFLRAISEFFASFRNLFRKPVA